MAWQIIVVMAASKKTVIKQTITITKGFSYKDVTLLMLKMSTANDWAYAKSTCISSVYGDKKTICYLAAIFI